MLVLLLFMHLLVVDKIIVILFCTMFRKVNRLQRLQNQCARILTKSPRREHITPVFMKLHLPKIQDRIIYKMLMLTYKSYNNMAPPYLCELINKKESHVNTRLGTDHHQLIMPPISQDCSNTFLERSFIYAAPCEWNKLSEHIKTNFDCFRKSVKTMLITQHIWLLTVNVYIIVIYDVITINYCKCILLYSPLNSYLYVHWILDFK